MDRWRSADDGGQHNFGAACFESRHFGLDEMFLINFTDPLMVLVGMELIKVFPTKSRAGME